MEYVGNFEIVPFMIAITRVEIQLINISNDPDVKPEIQLNISAEQIKTRPDPPQVSSYNNGGNEVNLTMYAAEPEKVEQLVMSFDYENDKIIYSNSDGYLNGTETYRDIVILNHDQVVRYIKKTMQESAVFKRAEETDDPVYVPPFNIS